MTSPLSADPDASASADADAEELARLRLIRRAKDVMDRDWARPIDLGAVAAAAGYSRFHFIRLFKQAYGETPGRYPPGAGSSGRGICCAAAI